MKEKRNNITELVFILDRSGSMSGLESDTIGGFNAMIQKQKKEDGEVYVSTILFDNVSEVLYDRIKLRNVPKMTAKESCGTCRADRNPGSFRIVVLLRCRYQRFCCPSSR